MIIVAGGDSFVYGSELGDCTGSYSQNTFAALLAQGHDYNCVAWPGIGNDGIARRVINEIESWLPEKPFVIVSWTFPGRYEFRFNYDTGQRTSPWYAINAWTVNDDVGSIQKEFVTQDNGILKHQIETIRRAKTTGVADFAKTFYKHVGDSEYWEVYSTLKEITYLQNHLKANRIPYLFTCADNNFWNNYTIQNADSVIHSLTEQIYRDQANWFWFPPGTGKNQTETPRGFYQWARENKYPIGTTHPLEQAHADAANLMKDKFNELVKKHLQQN
jgi:hypothetical protein